MFTIGKIAFRGGGNYLNSVKKHLQKGECPKPFATDCRRNHGGEGKVTCSLVIQGRGDWEGCHALSGYYITMYSLA